VIASSAMAGTDELIEEAKEIIQMWDEDDYDNFKDVIQDCRGALEDLPQDATNLRTELVRVLTEATTQFQELVDEDPSMADYAEGLIDPAYVKPD